MQGLSNDLSHIAKCPVCEKKYKKESATVLEIGQKRNTVHFTCESCQVASLVFISKEQAGIVGVGILTDLVKNEVRNVFQKEAVSADQVLGVHNFFKKYKYIA